VTARIEITMTTNYSAYAACFTALLGVTLACSEEATSAPPNTEGTGGAAATTGGAATSSTGATSSGGTSPRGSGGNGSDNLGGAAGSGNGTGGIASTGGADNTGGTSTVDADGCPLSLEGFASVDANGQDGTYGGRDGDTVTVTTQADLEKYAGATEPYTIRVPGALTISPKGKEIRVESNKTIVGVGDSAEIIQGGFNLASGVHNVIIRNLTIRDSFVEGDLDGKTQDYDGIQMDTAHHVWVDHCHLQKMGDGLIDSRKDTTHLTVSWSILSDHNKAFGIGWTENVTSELTVHHNWFRDLTQRNPSTDNVLRAHLFNNFMQRLGSYGNYARGGTNMVLENSVFEDVANPHYYDTGSLVARGNVYRDVSGQQESSGSTYSFFDPSDHYEYTLDPASEVEELLARCAGPRPSLGN
jgi:pectate lyase